MDRPLALPHTTPDTERSLSAHIQNSLLPPEATHYQASPLSWATPTPKGGAAGRSLAWRTPVGSPMAASSFGMPGGFRTPVSAATGLTGVDSVGEGPGLLSPPLLESRLDEVRTPPEHRPEKPFLRRAAGGGDHDLLCGAIQASLRCLPASVGEDLDLAVDTAVEVSEGGGEAPPRRASAGVVGAVTQSPLARSVPAGSPPTPRQPPGRPATATPRRRSLRASPRAANPSVVIPGRPSTAASTLKTSASLHWRSEASTASPTAGGHWKWVSDAATPMATGLPTSPIVRHAPGGGVSVDVAAARASLAAEVERCVHLQLDSSRTLPGAAPWSPAPTGDFSVGHTLTADEVCQHAARHTAVFRRMLKHVRAAVPGLALPLCRLWGASMHLVDQALAQGAPLDATRTPGSASPLSAVSVVEAEEEPESPPAVAHVLDDEQLLEYPDSSQRAALSEILVTHLKHKINKLEEELAVSKAMAAARMAQLQTRLADDEPRNRTSWSSADIGPVFQHVDKLQALVDDLEDHAGVQATALKGMHSVVSDMEEVTAMMVAPARASAETQTEEVAIGYKTAVVEAPAGPMLRSVSTLFGCSHPESLIAAFAKMKPSQRSERVLRVSKLAKILLGVWQEKALADARKGKKQLFAAFLPTYFLNLYGTKRMAMRHVYSLLHSLHKHRSCDHPRLQISLRLLGMVEPCKCHEPVPNGVCRCDSPREVPPETAAVVFRVVGLLMKLNDNSAAIMRGRGEEYLVGRGADTWAGGSARFTEDVSDSTAETDADSPLAGTPQVWVPLLPTMKLVREALPAAALSAAAMKATKARLLELSVAVVPGAGAKHITVAEKRDMLLKHKFMGALANAKQSSIRELFDAIDADGDGFVTAEEFREALPRLNLHMAESDMDKLMVLLAGTQLQFTQSELRAVFDVPQLKVELERVLVVVLDHLQGESARTTRQLLAHFHRADDGGSGFLTQAQFIKYVQDMMPVAAATAAAAFESATAANSAHARDMMHPYDFVAAVSGSPELAPLAALRRHKPVSPKTMPKSPAVQLKVGRLHHRTHSKRSMKVKG